MGWNYCVRHSNRWQFIVYLLLLWFSLRIKPSDAEDTLHEYSERIAEAKSKLIKMIQKETHKLNGFDEFGVVPVTYPLDICLMEIEQHLYAATLSFESDRTKTALKIFKKVPADPRNPLIDYIEIFSYVTRSARNMDCISFEGSGFVAVVNEVKSEQYDSITDGSPVYQLKGDKVTPVQYFMRPRQNRVHFINYQNQLFMWQTFSSGEKSNDKSSCPILKWADGTFNEFDHIPCTNAIEFEPFQIDNHVYLAVANYMDEQGNIETYSTIYQYCMDTHKFNLTQKIKTFGAIDVKYVSIDGNHFLFLANSYHAHHPAITSNAVVYRYEHAMFMPVQILPFDDEVEQFLPYLGNNNEFVLLVAMEEGTTKTYQFNGFTFTETPVTFTGGSFGRGVSKMRTFKMNGDIQVIVVANSEMYRDAANLFKVRFSLTMDYDFTKAFDLFDKWYAEVSHTLETDRIVEISEQIAAIKPPDGFSTIILKNTTVDVINAETISSKAIPIDFELFQKSLERAEEIVSNDTVRRPKRLNDSMLPKDLSAILDAEHEEDELEPPLPKVIDELTVTEGFFVEIINGHKMSDLVTPDSDLVLKNFTVDTLIIENNTEHFSAIERMLQESDDRMSRNAPDDDAIVLNDVIVNGFVNGIDFSLMADNVLRTDAKEQRIETEINFRTLRAKSITTSTDHFSNLPFSTIARINDNETLIRPPIHFTQGLNVTYLKVLERLNRIRIIDGKMDALFKRRKDVQVITGEKQFETLNLLDPIVLQGKMNISNSLVNKIKPIVTIDDDLVVENNVQFMGNVTVGFLSVPNIYGRSIRYNVLQLLSDGLRLDDPDIDIAMQFTQPIEIDNTLPGTRINNVPVDSLIRRNVSGVQKITARKTFLSDLIVEGDFCETKVLNGVDLEILNNTMLKRTGKNQVVTGSIQFRSIIANKVNVKKLILGKTPVERLLTTDTDQDICANVTIHGGVFIESNIDVHHLNTTHPILGTDLQDLLDDSYFDSPNEPITITSNKWFKNLTIGELEIQGNFWQVNRSTAEIVKQLNDYENGMLIHDPITFSSQLEISNLTVTGNINGIPRSRFGHEWLLTKGKQVFIAPQNFSDVTFLDNLQLYGSINGHDLQQLIDDTVNKSQPAQLNNFIFDNVIFEQSLEIGGRLSDIKFPDDLILRHSDSLQSFNNPLTFEADVNIFGTLSIADRLNGFSLSKVCDLLEPKSDAAQRLTIKGDVIFATDPSTEKLNGESFKHMMLTTWFANATAVNFTSKVHFDNVVFEKPITTSGTVNGVDLVNLNSRYLSLTEPQTVSTPLHFHNHVTFRDSVNIDSVVLSGLIKVPNSSITLNITDFDQNVLKNTSDTQVIRAPWTMNRMEILGDLCGTNINGLNFASDVARYSTPKGNIVRATKRFRSLTIDNLTCENGCTMQGVDMDDWIGGAVMNNLNYTIQGTVYARNPIISHITALGAVNNGRFDSRSVLLKSAPQTINGSLTIGNRTNWHSISPFTFDNLNVNYINDVDVNEFFGNIVRKDDGDVVIESDVVFRERVEFENFQVTGSLNGIRVNELLAPDHIVKSEQFRAASDELRSFVGKMSRRERFKHFKNFTERTTLPVEVHTLRKLMGSDFEFVTFNRSSVAFWSWQPSSKSMRPHDVPLALPQDMVVIDLTVLRFDLMHLLVVEMHDPHTAHFVHQFYDYTSDLQHAKLVHTIKHDAESSIEPFNLDQRYCFIIYRKLRATHFDVHCLDVADNDRHQLHMHQIDSQEVDAIQKMFSGYANTIILWFINGEIESRWYDTRNHQTHHVRDQFHNVTSVAARQFVDNTFVAVCMHSSVINKPSQVNARITIYRVDGTKLKHYADIDFPNSVVLQCAFSQLSINQPILVVAVRKSDDEVVQIYQDKGVNGFQHLAEHEIQLNATISPNYRHQIEPAHRFMLIESESDILTFIALHSKRRTTAFVECTYS